MHLKQLIDRLFGRKADPLPSNEEVHSMSPEQRAEWFREQLNPPMREARLRQERLVQMTAELQKAGRL